MHSTESLFKVNLKLPPGWSARILEWVEMHRQNPFLVYRWHPFRQVVDLHNISLATRELFPRKDRLDFAENIEWQWLHDHHQVGWITELIFWIQETAKIYFSRIGTVSLQVWDPGNYGLTPHFDFRMHKKSNHPRGDYREDRYWRLFFPLSENFQAEREDPPFYLIENQQEVYMSSDENAYFMHDPTCLHGVRPRGHRRGFLFVDGILNPEIFLKVERAPLLVKERISLDPEKWSKYFQENDLAFGREDSLISLHARNNMVLEEARQAALRARRERA